MRSKLTIVLSCAVSVIGSTLLTTKAPAKTLEPECYPNPIWTCDAPYNGTFSCEGWAGWQLDALCQSVNPAPDNCALVHAYCEQFEGCANYPIGGGGGESVYCEFVYAPTK